MRRRAGIAVAVALMALTAVLLTRPGSDETGGSNGSAGGPDRLPTIDIAALDGTGRIESASWAGEVVVVNLWASWCAPCVEELPALEQFATTVSGARVVGIAVRDSASLARGFARRAGVTYELGIDSSGAVARAFGLSGLPGTYVYGRFGDLVWSKAGQLESDDLRRLAAAVDAELNNLVEAP